MKLLFTYGTLMKGECRSHVLKDCEFVGDAELKDYGIIDLGPYPAAVYKEGYKVYGEVYRIPEELKPLLDEIEAEGYLYKYKEVNVLLNGKNTVCGFYEYLRDYTGYGFMEKGRKWRSH